LKLPLEKGMGFFGRLRSLRMTEKNAQNDKIRSSDAVLSEAKELSN